MQYEKHPEIVHETEDAYICTIWTGPNYYIGWFPKAELDAFIAYAEECGHFVTFDQAIARTHVDEMHFMCKSDEYCQEVLEAWIKYFIEGCETNTGTTESSEQRGGAE